MNNKEYRYYMCPITNTMYRGWDGWAMQGSSAYMTCKDNCPFHIRTCAELTIIYTKVDLFHIFTTDGKRLELSKLTAQDLLYVQSVIVRG